MSTLLNPLHEEEKEDFPEDPPQSRLKFLTSRHFFLSLIALYSSYGLTECLGTICPSTFNEVFKLSDFVFVLPSLVAANICIYWLYYFYGIQTGTFKTLYFTTSQGIFYKVLNIAVRHSGGMNDVENSPQTLKDIEKACPVPQDYSVMQFLLKNISDRTGKVAEGYEIFFGYWLFCLFSWIYTFIMASYGFSSYNFCVGSVYAPWNLFVFAILTTTASTLMFIYENLEDLLKQETARNEDGYLELLVLFQYGLVPHIHMRLDNTYLFSGIATP